MTFNGTEKENSLIAHIDFLLFGSSATLNTAFSLVDRTGAINREYDELVADLFKADPTFKWDDSNNVDFPIATLDLTASQTHITIPDSALVVHRVRIKDRVGNYMTLDPVMRNEVSDSDLNNTGTPRQYYKLGNAVFLSPVPDYSYGSGIELEFQRSGIHFESTDTTKTPGFNPQFHHILSYGAALQYAIVNGLPNKAQQFRAEKELLRLKMREHYETRSKDDRVRMQLRRGSVRSYGLNGLS